MRIEFTACAAACVLLLGGCSGGEKSETSAQANATGTEVAAAASADAPAAPKEGLWEMKTSAAGMPQAQAVKLCVGAPQPGANPFTPPPAAGQACSKNAVTKIADGYQIDSECTANGMTATSKGTVTGDFASAYKIEMATKMGGPNVPAAAQQEIKTVIDAKYLGECPADLKPGQAQTS